MSILPFRSSIPSIATAGSRMFVIDHTQPDSLLLVHPRSPQMANILTLPNEILLGVFELLDGLSLAKTKKVCNRFWKVIRQMPVRFYALNIDEPGHSAWKFMRHLLNNPKAASHITELAVEWNRRDPEDPNTWTERWEWAEAELHRMQELEEEIINKYLTPETYEAIKGGVNSEALLPLILCFTENLECLDLGEAVLELFNCEGWPEACMTKALNIKPDDAEQEFKEGDNGVPTIIQTHVPEEDCVLWFHLNTGYFGSYLPGLARLKKFTHRLYDKIFISEDKWGWRADYFLPILFIPGIEEITIGGCATEERGGGYSLDMVMRWYGDKFNNMPDSTVKKLIIDDARMDDLNYKILAFYTCCLEELYISNNYAYAKMFWEYGTAHAIREFLQRNSKTLSLDRISVDGRSSDDWLGKFYEYDIDTDPWVVIEGEGERGTYEKFVENFWAWSKKEMMLASD
ncbi:hypothetical protein TWF506_008206 [Arthrobotrys conoides]|uniref:F-box domain-containing protein n=1 Tax=Arthrobotrys conoides TaxID=74498 RepID=A0AAN8RMI5_9PEZI